MTKLKLVEGTPKTGSGERPGGLFLVKPGMVPADVPALAQRSRKVGMLALAGAAAAAPLLWLVHHVLAAAVR